MIELACGIHEASREIDPCPACVRARAANAKELAGMVVSGVKKAAHRARAERAAEALRQEAEMAGSPSKFSEAERRAAIARLDAGESTRVVALSIGVSPALLPLWRKKLGIARPARPDAPAIEKPSKADRVNDLLGDVRPMRTRQVREHATATPPVAPSVARASEPSPMREAAPVTPDVVDVIEGLGVSYAIGRVIEALVAGDLDRAFVALDRARARRAA